jgi:hypothetical protein
MSAPGGCCGASGGDAKAAACACCGGGGDAWDLSALGDPGVRTKAGGCGCGVAALTLPLPRPADDSLVRPWRRIARAALAPRVLHAAGRHPAARGARVPVL